MANQTAKALAFSAISLEFIGTIMLAASVLFFHKKLILEQQTGRKKILVGAIHHERNLAWGAIGLLVLGFILLIAAEIITLND